MSKIGNLQVDTINIAEESMSARYSVNRASNGQTDLTVSNPSGQPVEVYLWARSLYSSSSSGNTFSFSSSVSLVSPTPSNLCGYSWVSSGNASITEYRTGASLVVENATSFVFRLSTNATQTSGSLASGILNANLTAITQIK